MTTVELTQDLATPAQSEALRKALASTPRPPRSSALTATMTFA